MFESAPSFRPVRAREGYPPLEDLGLIGDGATVETNVPERRLAIVGIDGERRPADQVEQVLAERRRSWTPEEPRRPNGILSLYSRIARGASEGATIT